jgi:hypothetical protein
MSSYNMNNVGLQTTPAIDRTLFAFAGIALYNVVELMTLIFATFHRKGGLYFWSLIVATLAILPYTLGLLFKFYTVIPISYISIALIDIGWQGMVMGQSVVLYSRLHLVAPNQNMTRYVLAMIIANWFISNVPTTIFVFMANSPLATLVTKSYSVWERLQLTLYFVQELVISGLYLYEIARVLKPDIFEWTRFRKDTHKQHIPRQLRTVKGQKVMKHLFLVNVIIILLDLSLLVSEFIGHYEIQVLYKVCLSRVLFLSKPHN